MRPERRRGRRGRSPATPSRSHRSAERRASRCRRRAAPDRTRRPQPRRRRAGRPHPSRRGAASCSGPRSSQRRSGCEAAACSSVAHAPIASLPSGGFARWSITIVSLGKFAASSGTSPRWRGKTHGSSRIIPLSCRAARLVSTVAWSIQCGSGSLWMRWRKPLSFGSDGDRRVADELAPANAARARRHGPDPWVEGSVLEHGVGVEVGACRLHEHGPLDTSPLKKWLEIPRLGRSAG